MHILPESVPKRRNVKNRAFVGRDKELGQLRDRLFRRDLMPWVMSVSGSAGVGKTALLNALFSTSRIDAATYWLDLHGEISPEASIEKFVNGLHLNPPQRRSIVVLDGAEYLTGQALDITLRKLFNWKATISVFIGSRKQIKQSGPWPAGNLELGLLNESETAEMFLNLVGVDTSTEDAENLFRQTKGLPLAVTIFAASRTDVGNGNAPLQIDGRLYDLSTKIAVPSTKLVEAIRPAIVNGTDELIRLLQRQPRAIYDLPPRAFEQVLADLLVDMGWDVHLTQATRDGGKDILAYMNTPLGRLLCLVEAKRYSEHRKVGVDIVRTLYGTLCDHQANSGVLVTTSSFSKDAQEFRQRHRYQLALRDYEDVTRWIQGYGSGKRVPLFEVN
jgi:restriction system protein